MGYTCCSAANTTHENNPWLLIRVWALQELATVVHAVKSNAQLLPGTYKNRRQHIELVAVASTFAQQRRTPLLLSEQGHNAYLPT